MPGSARVLLALAVLLLQAGTAPAQSPGAAHASRSVRALSVEAAGLTDESSEGAPIRLDGRLTEPAWEEASSASDFRQRNPDEGDPATESTDVRVVYGPASLYVGVRARDHRPERLIARILERDQLMRPHPFDPGFDYQGDDFLAVLIDPFHGHRSAMVFATNPNGAKFEALLSDQGQQVTVEWRSVWSVEARRTAEGWSAEFEIPFRTLRYPTDGAAGGGQTWGFNVLRMIRRKNEETLWSSWSRDGAGFARVSRAGHLTGLRDLPQSGLNLELKPYSLAGVTKDRTVDGRPVESRLEAGVTGKWEVQPGLVLDATVNPDFSQVEVDREQVNLTRFSLFFPEKRDFFLENAGVFDFGLRGRGRSPPPFLLFFSRRIGLHDGGTVPLIAGTRLSGRIGDQKVGFLDVVTDEAQGLPHSNHGVLRIKRDIGTDSYLGAMVTDLRRGLGPGDGGDHPDNTAGGVDWSLWTGDRTNWTGFLVGTTTKGPGGDDVSYRLAGEYRSSTLQVGAGHLFIGPDLRIPMGFAERQDVRKTDGSLELISRPDWLGLRALKVGLIGSHVYDESWEVQDWRVGPFLSPEWDAGEDLLFIYRRSYTRLQQPFRLTNRVTVPAGEYDMWRFRTQLETSSRRRMWGRIELVLRGFYGGTLTGTGGEVNFSVNRHLGLRARYRHNDAGGPWGDFTSDVLSLRLQWAASTDLSGDAVVQYNSLDDRINAKARVRLIHGPGSDLYLVVSEQRGSGPLGIPSAERSSFPVGGRLGVGNTGELGHAAVPGAGPRAALWDVRERNVTLKVTYLLQL